MAEVLHHRPGVPRVVLMCHEGDRIDTEGLTAWVASSMDLVGVIRLKERRSRAWQRVRREIRRVGLLRFLDVLAFRFYYRLMWGRRDAAWIDDEVQRLKARYPVDPSGVMTLVTHDPNGPAVRAFLRWVRPHVMIARCKTLLKPEVFGVPSHGTYALHPGICPEYRNAHGCFWALANRDVQRVGMTLLKVDPGVDTGPILLQASYGFDELKESHAVMQYRVVLENLDAVAEKLRAAWRGYLQPLPVVERKSATWGQPWLSAYFRWKHAARQGMPREAGR
ncbi:MAG TPA: formyltransferase family protein [Gammaproteobacteria bacterium]